MKTDGRDARELCLRLDRYLAGNKDSLAVIRVSFLDACRRANAGQLSQPKLAEETVRLGFNNVIDAFHIVGQSEVTQRFFIDECSRGGGIRITDAFSKLLESERSPNLSEETEALALS